MRSGIEQAREHDGAALTGDAGDSLGVVPQISSAIVPSPGVVDYSGVGAHRDGDAHIASGGGLRVYAISILLVAVVIAAVVLFAARKTGSIRAGVAYLAGDYVYAHPNGPVIESSSAKGIGTTKVSFTNLSGKPVRVVGYNNRCSCLRFVGLPLELGPRATGELLVEARLADEAHDVSVEFATDEPGQGWVHVDVEVPAARIDSESATPRTGS
jgi:hypothetical protein